jgi:hybrid polyketide synthase/nonribosomal peptide synthetase ACE1
MSSADNNTIRGGVSRFNVLLTGATGQLGRHVLSQLVNNVQTTRVICLTRQPDKIEENDKITTLQGDVSEPNFGLSELEYQQLVTGTDVIMHCAANRSFWDRYEVLQPVNVSAVKGLVGIVADSGRIIPLHVMSSGAVAQYYNLGAIPPQDGSDGYVASKWAAERFLRRIAAETSIPIYIHRPSGVDGGALGSSQEREAVTDQLMSIVSSMEIEPEFGGIDGTLDIAPVDDMAESLAQLVLKSIIEAAGTEGSDRNLIHEFKHKAALQVYARDFAARLRKEGQHFQFPKMPILEWFGQAKAAGFSYIIAAQELVMTSGLDTLTTRR